VIVTRKIESAKTAGVSKNRQTVLYKDKVGINLIAGKMDRFSLFIQNL